MPLLSPTPQLDKLTSARHSCRAFTEEPLTESLVRHLLATAHRSASWCNVQPWQVVVTAGAETEHFRSFLAHRIPGSDSSYDVPPPGPYTGVHAARRKESGLALYRSVGVGRDDPDARARQAWQNFTFFGAPHVAILTSDAAIGPYGLVDCGGWLSTFLLAATEAGVATIAQAAIAAYAPLVREFFALPEHRHIICAVSFGRPSSGHPANGFRTTRAPLEEIADMRGFAS